MAFKLERALKHQKCTVSFIGEQYVQQMYYGCKTCKISVEDGFCEVCAKTCHSGHELEQYKVRGAYFDVIHTSTLPLPQWPRGGCWLSSACAYGGPGRLESAVWNAYHPSD